MSNRLIMVHQIISHFGNESNLVLRGEKSYEAGHVVRVQYDKQILYLTGTVLPSMKNDRAYDVTIDFNMDGSIKLAKCLCPRGLVRCHRIAALLIYAHLNISKTDQLCQWVKKKDDSDDAVCTIEDLFPDSHLEPYVAPSYIMSKEAKEKFYRKQKRYYGLRLGFSFILCPEPAPNSDLKPVHVLESTLMSSELRSVLDKVGFLIEQVKLSPEKIAEIERCTVGQSGNPNWLIVKRYLVTASNFLRVLTAYRSKNFVSLYKSLLGTYYLGKVLAIAYGHASEPEAKKEFESYFNVQVQDCGIFLHESGLIGASPDGIINDEELLEIKCPYKMRKPENMLESVKADKNNVLKLNKMTGLFEVNKKHPYYHQIQGQLYLSGRQRCILMIWSKKDFLVHSIVKDETWSCNIEILLDFYKSHFLHHILNETSM